MSNVDTVESASSTSSESGDIQPAAAEILKSLSSVADDETRELIERITQKRKSDSEGTERITLVMDGDGSDQEEAALRVLEDAFGKLEPFEDWCTDCESSPRSLKFGPHNTLCGICKVIATIDKHLEDMAEIRRKFGWPSMEEEQEEARKRQKEKEALDARFLPDIDHWTDEEYDDEEVTELASNPHERVDRSSSVGKATRGKGKEVAHD